MMKLFLKSRIKEIILFFIIIGLFVLSMFLYQLPTETAIYPALLCFFALLIYLALSYAEEKKRVNALFAIRNYEDVTIGKISDFKNSVEAEYQRIITDLAFDTAEITEKDAERYNEMTDYYTLWAHQIKTPISSMNLILQSQDTPECRQALRDLHRIEQYVQMVLTYIRLDTNTSDYVLREYELDDIITDSVRKFSSEFIAKKIGIEIKPTGYKLITDEKWLGFVIEQILSNSLKYSEHGVIKIGMKDKILSIGDEGIGIAKEDLPRIFERGYTGYNGRSFKKASGIGLYLCRRICDNMNIKITAVSEPGIGTTVSLDLNQYEIKQ